MAEKEEERVHAHKRNTYSGRGHPGQKRLYNQLGVKDLRELLDRKRNERGQATEPHYPPPDPSYNYLKDPLRENEENNSHEQQTRPSNARKYHNKNNPNNNYQRQREPYAGNASNHPKNRDIENPMNIKVEFSTSTGEHVYKMDETTILPTIKHVPDRLPSQNRSFRGRGRGRGRGQQRTYQTRTIRSNNLDRRTPKNTEDKETPKDDLQSVHSNPQNCGDESNENKNQSVEDYDEEVVDDGQTGEQLQEADLEETLEAVQNLTITEDQSQTENSIEDNKSGEKDQEKKE